jgi:DNA polymerase-1
MRILILDAYNLILRAYHGLPPAKDTQGRGTHAIRGWFNTWLKLKTLFQTERVIAVFDSGTDPVRKRIHPPYRTGRGDKPPDLIEQIEAICQASPLASIANLTQPEAEADDLIYTLAQSPEHEILIVSDDKDLAHCVSDSKNIQLYRPSKNEIWREKEVTQNLGVRPGQIPSFLALSGDPVDKIPGMPGIGNLTAVKLLSIYPDIHSALSQHPKYASRYTNELQPLAEQMLQLTQLKIIPACPALHELFPDKGQKPQPSIQRSRMIEFLQARSLRRVAEQIQRSGETTQETFLFNR